ncbi:MULTISPECIES: hypothetical protein [Streptomyces]|uniref:hypothetical protein n=1 Tax=Streptomyces TaxID=1883 RepID=UPI00130221C5|nr:MULTISPECIES: hypothetical protein [Streptomyces]
MSDADVTHGGLFGDAEKPHELERVAGDERFVEDPGPAPPLERADIRKAGLDRNHRRVKGNSY